jgi:hypothetical protein
MNIHEKKQQDGCDTTSYAALLAHGLVCYAANTAEYGRWLSSLLSNYTERLVSLSSGASTLIYTGTQGMIPRSEDMAARRTIWLLDAITERRITGYRDASAVLHAWHMSRAYDEPKAVVLGIKYGVLNYGIIGHPPNRREPMGVLIRKDVLKQYQGLQLATLLNQVTHRVVEQGLIQAQGSTSQLEPELGDWLFGDKSLAIYRAEASTLQVVLENLVHMGAPYAHQTDDGGVTALAFSPVLYVADLPGNEGLEPVEVS